MKFFGKSEPALSTVTGAALSKQSLLDQKIGLAKYKISLVDDLNKSKNTALDGLEAEASRVHVETDAVNSRADVILASL